MGLMFNQAHSLSCHQVHNKDLIISREILNDVYAKIKYYSKEQDISFSIVAFCAWNKHLICSDQQPVK